MSSKKWIVLGLVIAASVLLAATVAAGPGPSRAEPQRPGERLAAAASSPVSTTFTYQGRLDKDGEPVK